MKDAIMNGGGVNSKPKKSILTRQEKVNIIILNRSFVLNGRLE